MGDYAEARIVEALERGDVRAASLWKSIKAQVDAAPPLTPALRDQLRVLLQPAPAAPHPRAVLVEAA